MIVRVLISSAILALTACAHPPAPAEVAGTGPNAGARAPYGETQALDIGGAKIVVHTAGTRPAGPGIVMLASAGREASDFNELAEALVHAGHSTALFEAPGINGATASAEAPTLFDLADDVGRYLEHRGGTVVLVGHAFGNRLARAVATRYPGRVSGVVLIGAGGLKPIAPEAAKALRDSFDPRLSPQTHEAAVRYGFFAGDNPVPDYWLRGWHVATGEMQGAATRAVESRDWWTAGGKPLLVIAGMQDTIAPPEDTVDLLEAELGSQVTGIRIEGAGHALLPEAPEEIRSAILTWLSGLTAREP